MTDEQEQERVARLARELQQEAEAAAAEVRLNGPNVVPFEGAAAEEKKEETPSHAEILELLEAMDDVEYDRSRKAKAREWGILLSTLDRLRKHAKLRQEYAQQPQPDDSER